MQEVPPAVLNHTQPHPSAPEDEPVAFPAGTDLVEGAAHTALPSS
ncbi:hypothetical protein [Streptomyces sp. NPDC048385]